jgi:hypothetical protein
VISDFLSNGGDAFSVFKEGTNAAVGDIDLEALASYLSRAGITALPALDRLENRTPQ